LSFYSFRRRRRIVVVCDKSIFANSKLKFKTNKKMELAEYFAFIVYLAKIRITIAIVGFVGNAITFIVFSKKAFSNISLSVYGRALVLVDMHILIALVRDLCSVFLELDIMVLSLGVCKTLLYINLSLTSVSGWLTVAFSLDKFISMTRCKRLKFALKRCNQYRIAVIIVVSHFVAYFTVVHQFVLTYTQIAPNVTMATCNIFTMPNKDLLFVMFVLDSLFGPFVLMMLATFVITHKLVSSRKKLEFTANRIWRERRLRDRKFAVTSIVMNVVFILLQGSVILPHFVRFDDFLLDRSFKFIILLIFNMSYSTRFFIYFISNSIFRHEFLIIFKK
jgi:hypothetical protein